MNAPPLPVSMAPAQIRSTGTPAPAKMAIQEAGVRTVGGHRIGKEPSSYVGITNVK